MSKTIVCGLLGVVLAAGVCLCGCRSGDLGSRVDGGEGQSARAAARSDSSDSPADSSAAEGAVDGGGDKGGSGVGADKRIALDRGSLQLYVDEQRVYVVKYRGEIVGGANWKLMLSYDGVTRMEEFTRSMFRTGIDDEPYRYVEREKQSIENGEFAMYWASLLDDVSSGRFRVRGTGESAEIKTAYSGGKYDTMAFAAPANYISSAKVSAWCVTNRAKKGRSREFSRPLWFTDPPGWVTMVITSEGKDSTTTAEGKKISAWRYRVHCKSVKEVYALVWLDDFNKVVRRELPFCGVELVMATSGWADHSVHSYWGDARKHWGIDGVGPIPEIIGAAHRRLEEKAGQANRVDERRKKEAAEGSSGDTVVDLAVLALFHFFL